MSNRVSYTHRRNVLEFEKTVTVDGDDLVLKEGNTKEQRLPLRDIARLRLAFEPTRMQSGLYTCRIWSKHHAGAWAVLHSQSYRGFADFEAHDAEYRAFVEALNAAVVRSNPKAKFEAGSSTWLYVLNIFFVMVGVLALIWILVLTGGEGWSDITITKAFLVLGMIPLAIAWIRANRPRLYDPRAIPESVMPPVGTPQEKISA
jgi:hypothetical protein